MTVPLEKRVVGPGDPDRLEAAWTLKERIRDEEAILEQDRDLFERAYRGATVFLRARPDGRLVGFAAARVDAGYLLVLAVSPDHRRSGIGRDLVESVASVSPRVTCHVRVGNEAAIAFYRQLGFTVQRRVNEYYSDGEDAHFLDSDFE